MKNGEARRGEGWRVVCKLAIGEGEQQCGAKVWGANDEDLRIER